MNSNKLRTDDDSGYQKLVDDQLAQQSRSRDAMLVSENDSSLRFRSLESNNLPLDLNYLFQLDQAREGRASTIDEENSVGR